MMEMIFAFLLLHLIQYNVAGKHFLVETKDDNTRRIPSGLVCEYFVHCVCKISEGHGANLSLKWVCAFAILHQCFTLAILFFSLTLKQNA